MSEATFQAWVVDTAVAFGWRVWHVPTPMRPIGGGRFVPDHRGAGLCDLIGLHVDPPRLLLAELKDIDGRFSDEQLEFLRLARGLAGELRRLLAEAGLDRLVPIGVYSWRPGAEPLIEDVLRSRVMVP